MSEFNSFKKGLNDQFKRMTAVHKNLFVTGVEKDALWDTYLNSFPEGTNPIYKERREYDCNGCKQFIRPYGNVVVIEDNKLISIWDIPNLEYPFNVVAEKMSTFVKSQPIANAFVTTFAKLGVDKNHQMSEDGVLVKTWNHFFFELPASFMNHSSHSVGDVQGQRRDFRNVFKRSMDEITMQAAQTTLELIEQDSIYRGAEFKAQIVEFIKYKKLYEKLSDSEKANWCWVNAVDNFVAKIRNNAIGTFLVDLSNGVELDAALSKFEKVMAPYNYKRPKAVFTQKMIEEAEKTIVELGFSDSLARRHVKLEDITVNNVIFVNRDVKKNLSGSVFDDLKKDIPVNIKKLNKVEEIGIEEFLKLIPNINNIELMMEARHQGNLMSLIAPKNIDAPSMLKWSNNFSWAYNGDITDSMKENVKAAGGKVDGVLRFSIQWNEKGDNNVDYDAHCVEPGGNEICYRSKVGHHSTGMLDVDIINPAGKVAVENITWSDLSRMKEGRYKFFVETFSGRGSASGFRAEIEYNGEIHLFDFNGKTTCGGDRTLVAEVDFSKENGLTFIKSMDSTSATSSRKIWSVDTNQFMKANLVMFSPNYWDDQKGIGNKHYFFILEGCKNDSTPRGFFNEFLKDDLMQHKRVFEALGSKMRVEDSDNQLSGLGFSSTQRNSIIAKVDGAFKRTLKINF